VTLHLYATFDSTKDTAGELTRTRAQVVADSSLRLAAERIGFNLLAIETAPSNERANAERLVSTGKPLASMFEALIAACWIEFGPQRTSSAVIETLSDSIMTAREEPADEKSLLQEELARHGESVRYESKRTGGPAHEPVFEARAIRVSDEVQLGAGTGASKKAAEREAAGEALAELRDRQG
jgi:ribonuclease-3